MPQLILDPYAELGLPRGAEAEEVKQAYRRLAFELHPDRTGDDSEAAERLLRVNRAYEQLTRTSAQPQVVYVPVQPPPAPPRRVAARTLGRIGLIVCVVGFAGGLWFGRSGGADVQAAGAAGLANGRSRGEHVGKNRAYRLGLQAGARSGYEETMRLNRVPVAGVVNGG